MSAVKVKSHARKKAASRRRKFKGAFAARMDKGGRVFTLRQKMGATRKIFARITSMSERSVASLETGKPLSESAERRVAEIERLQEALASVIEAETIGPWLQEPNHGFDGLKPIEVIVALKNLLADRGIVPRGVDRLVEGLVATGRSALVTKATLRNALTPPAGYQPTHRHRHASTNRRPSTVLGRTLWPAS